MLSARRLFVAAASSVALLATLAVGSAQAATVAAHSTGASALSWSPTISPALKADIAKAKPLDVTVTKAQLQKMAKAALHPGVAGKAAGAAGSVTSLAPSNVKALGSAGQPWWGSLYTPPATTTGKVFFSDHNGNWWQCSGSLVNSAGKDLVITAGHCVYGAAGGEIPGEGWHQNWQFIPDYRNGSAPYGVWYATQLWTLTAYVNSPNQTDEGQDLGAAILPTHYGTHAVNWLGGQGYAWNQSTSQYIYDFGYPAGAPFNGLINDECDGWDGYSSYINQEVLASNFTGGSSGGPWLMYFNGQLGYENGVNDARFSVYPWAITSLYFGNNAYALYAATYNL